MKLLSNKTQMNIVNARPEDVADLTYNACPIIAQQMFKALSDSMPADEVLQVSLALVDQALIASKSSQPPTREEVGEKFDILAHMVDVSQYVGGETFEVTERICGQISSRALVAIKLIQQMPTPSAIFALQISLNMLGVAMQEPENLHKALKTAEFELTQLTHQYVQTISCMAHATKELHEPLFGPIGPVSVPPATNRTDFFWTTMSLLIRKVDGRFLRQRSQS